MALWIEAEPAYTRTELLCKRKKTTGWAKLNRVTLYIWL